MSETTFSQAKSPEAEGHELPEPSIINADAAGQNDVPDAERDQDSAEAEPTFNIRDKRFWARDGADDTDETPKKPTYVEELERQLADKEARLQGTLVQYKEALDEFESAKGRLRRDVTKEIEAGKRAMLADLLDVVDNLERAITAPGTNATDSLLAGVTMVRDQFLAKLQNLGVRRLDALGELFDPLHFEAVSIVPVSDPKQDGKVVGVVRDAYVMGDETLRHGMVAVGKAPQSVEAATPAGDA